MKRVSTRILLLAGLLGATPPVLPQSVLSQSALPPSDGNNPRFAAIDIYLEASEPLAAWQFELRESSGLMRVVGVENGDSGAFRDAPYYDLAAVNEGMADRIIVADYSTNPAAELPTGRSRVATVHVQLEGPTEPDYVLNLMTAGGADGAPIRASIEFETQ